MPASPDDKLQPNCFRFRIPQTVVRANAACWTAAGAVDRCETVRRSLAWPRSNNDNRQREGQGTSGRLSGGFHPRGKGNGCAGNRKPAIGSDERYPKSPSWPAAGRSCRLILPRQEQVVQDRAIECCVPGTARRSELRDTIALTANAYSMFSNLFCLSLIGRVSHAAKCPQTVHCRAIVPWGIGLPKTI